MWRLREVRFQVLLLALADCAFGAACDSSPSQSSSVTDGSADDGVEPAIVVAAPDLRFKWVASGFTLTLRKFTNAGTGGPEVFTERGAVAATPLDLTGEGTSEFSMFSTNVNLEPMLVVGASGSLPSLHEDLDGLLTVRSIVVSLDCAINLLSFPDQRDGLYNVTLTGAQGGAISYLPADRASVAAADFPAWVAGEGMSGRVVTALCPKDDALYATSFGRTGDAASYETQVVTTTLDGLATHLTTLASGGYFITALGRDGTGIEGAGGFVIVGTRMAGAITERSIKIIDEPCVVGGAIGVEPPVQRLFDEGYALVGEIFHDAGGCSGAPTWAFIGEK
jgi:hypothetical protein